MKADALSRTIQDICSQDATRLKTSLALDLNTARIEVQCLLQAVLQVNRAYLLTHPEQQLSTRQNAQYMVLFEHRLNGEPIAYLLGEREFYGMNFKISPATLIPRPDTELLVELALQRIPSDGTTSLSNKPSKDNGQIAGYPGLAVTLSRPNGHPLPQAGEELGEMGCERGQKFCILDLGTGSGAIALAIAHARPAAEVLACDASPAALAVARENAQRLGIVNAAFVQSDWFAALGEQRFDLIVSNPPYIAIGDPHLQCGDVRFEPPSALASGEDGLHDIRLIVSQAGVYLNPGGWLLLEHGYNQAAQVRDLLWQAGFEEVFSALDMAGIERVSGGHTFA